MNKSPGGTTGRREDELIENDRRGPSPYLIWVIILVVAKMILLCHGR